MSTEVIARVLIRGRVQGIGFRAFIQREARRLNLEGWVRNRRTGALEAMFAGTPEAVDAIVELCRKGPPGAQIGVAITAADAAGPLLFASLAGARRELTDAALLRLLLRLPLLTLRVTAAIYWHAAQLWWKRIGVRAHPAKPAQPVTIVRGESGS